MGIGENIKMLITHLSAVIKVHLFNGFAATVEIDETITITAKEEKIPTLSEETILSAVRLAQILRPIRARLLSNGYNITNGEIKRINYEQKPSND